MLLHAKAAVPFLVLPLSTLFLIFSSLHLACEGALQVHQLSEPAIHTLVITKEGDWYSLVQRETRRRSLLGENTDGDSVDNNKSSIILAAERTHRKDPLDNLRYYEGGWNIEEIHYFSSTAYTAAPLFVIALFWFFGFSVTLLVICIRHCCCKLKNYDYSRTIYALSLLFLILFTVSAIIGCVVLYTGEEKFHQVTESTLEYVVSQADNTVTNLTIVSEYLSAAKNVGVDQFSLPSSVQNNINNVERMINASATTLQNETNTNRDEIHGVLHAVRVTLITVAAVMLLLSFIGFLLSILGKQRLVYILATIGWILATAALILCCVFIILHNVVGDTCVAMDEWVQNPTARTTLDDILPCLDNATAQETLSQSKNVTYQLVDVVNHFITNVANLNLPPNLPPNLRKLYYNQTGPLVPILCNPLNPDLTDRTCAAGEVNVNNASLVWSKYVCQVSSNGSCTTIGRLTPTFYSQMMSAVNVVYALHHYGPFLVGLVDCTFVRETFNGIVSDHCPDLKLHTEWVVIGLLKVSLAVMFSLVFWVFYARERRHRVYTKQAAALSAQNSMEEQKAVQ